MSYDVTGTVKVIGETQSFGTGDFTKRELVLVVEDGKYPQEISIEFIKDQGDKLDALAVGQECTVTFDLRGREHNGRWFNSLNGWKLSASDAPAPSPAKEEDDDVPF
jgi:hypothetical protein